MAQAWLAHSKGAGAAQQKIDQEDYMPDNMSKVKITVLKRTFDTDLVQKYLDTGHSQGYGICDQFREGQEFVTDKPWNVPEGFCTWAWADIRADIQMISAGGDLSWIKERGVAIASCTDPFRPVIFKIERLQ
jgi:uncharacterized repeat protein (TIGR04076 family)